MVGIAENISYICGGVCKKILSNEEWRTGKQKKSNEKAQQRRVAALSEAGVGFEPTNDGFANRCLRPLGYPANVVVAGRSIHGNGAGVKVKM